MGWFLRPLAPPLDEEVPQRSCVGSISYPPIPRLFDLEMAMEIWWAHIFFFFSFFFRGGYGAWGSDPLHLLLSGGVACVVATFHAKISWEVLSSDETFQYFHVFWGAPFLNPLCFSFTLTPLISQLLLCLFPWFHYNKMYFQWRKNSSLKVQIFVTKDL